MGERRKVWSVYICVFLISLLVYRLTSRMACIPIVIDPSSRLWLLGRLSLAAEVRPSFAVASSQVPDTRRLDR
jgi:hypothetical protein